MKVQLLIFKAKIIKKRKMSKKMMIFYRRSIKLNLGETEEGDAKFINELFG